ncbi:MAG TPA: DUF192 domain-containing protein [Thermomicrobiales bacterium]|nr:DUF192 domain-containing protein [Thermomicrobiales bacterium]
MVMTPNRRVSGLIGALALILALTGLVATMSVRAQEATPATQSGSLVPAAPPWRAELVPRNRPLVVTVGDTEVPVEVANNDRERSLGLGQRDGLLPGTGMLFVFDQEPEIRNFWMGGMRFCLDIVWVDGGEIIGAAQNTCPGPPGEGQDLIPRHQSPGVSEYVLEVPAGFLAENGYGVGTPVTFSVDPYSLPVPDEDAG